MKNESPLFKARTSNQQLSMDGVPSCNLNELKIDLENWMGQLPEFLTKVPLIYLSIPGKLVYFEGTGLISIKNWYLSFDKYYFIVLGSHNSFSYSISPDSKVSPDSPPFVQSLGKWCKPFTNRIIYNWSQGQKEDVIQQLIAGIRYFDVRLVVYDDEIVISHGLYGGHIQGFLEDMNRFLESHEKEVVILDFQHFYEFNPEHHERMISMLIHIFGDKICHRRRRMKENTLQKFWELKNQILIVYRHQVTRFNDIFWPSGTWATPWPNKLNVNKLIDCLNKGLSCRKEGMGYVSQGILTPTPKYVALHVFGSLKNLASQTNEKVISWLESKSNGMNGVNVVICDFVEKYNFCKKVVLLNYKIEGDYQKHFGLCDENQYQEGIKY